MNHNLRKPIIAGNWKMNFGIDETKKFFEDKELFESTDAEVVFAVPYISLMTALEEVKGTNIKIAAQNCHWEESGAFTGEISAKMLANMGVEYVLIGHSERRQFFGETDETINKRLKAALSVGLKPILCVGELLSEREKGITDEVVSMQTKIALLDISKEEMKNIVVAYEPVWAIGTGKTATSDEASNVCEFIRSVIADLYDENTANSTVIQYGGSMNSGNADELLSKENIDGGLIGGASLKPADFSKIIESAKK